MALRLGARSAQRSLAATSADFGACDDASVAAAPGRLAAFDGRIDNRGELLSSLGLDDMDRQDDAGLLLAVHEKWGDDAFGHIIGDYAGAVWDEHRRRLIMATDPGALRTLFFWQGKGRVLFASEQRGLFADPDVAREPDREQMAAWLTMMPREPLRTFFQDIKRVPPGHHVVWQDGRLHVHRWWRPEDVPVLRLGDDGEYEAALREMMDRAIRCRIGPARKVGSHLSAGLDSTTVTALAARQLAAQGRPLTAFTAAPRRRVVDPPGRIADEWPHAAMVARQHPNIDHVRIDNDAMPLLDALAWAEMGNDWPLLNGAGTVWRLSIDRAARERGINTMLVGQMGNMTISFNGAEFLAGRIRRGDLSGSIGAMLEMRRGGGISWLAIAAQATRAFLPVRANRALRRLLGKDEPDVFDYSAIHPDFLRRSGIAERARTVAGDISNLTIGDSRALRLAVLDRSDHRGHWAMGTRRLFGVETLDPTADRRLIELCLSIPDEQFIKGGVQRSLIRRCMGDLLPAPLLNQRRRGLQGADWRIGFEAALPALRREVASLRNSAYASECLDLDRLDALLDDWPSADKAIGGPYATAFSRALNVGRFIRRIEGGNG